MYDSVRPHRWQLARLPHPWDSPGKNTGVGCHFLLQCMKVKSESEVAQSCLTLSDPMDCSPPGSSVHGIFQARVLEWGAIAFSKNKHIGIYKMKTWDFKETPCLWQTASDYALSQPPPNPSLRWDLYWVIFLWGILRASKNCDCNPSAACAIQCAPHL